MLVAFCGIDGSGKTTQINLLNKRIENKYPVYLTKQPTDFYRKYNRFRQYVNGDIDSNDDTILYELALFAASDKLRHYQEEIKPNMNKVILCDRHVFSGYSYFLARGLTDIEWLKSLNCKLKMPDVVFYIDVDPQISMKRILQRDGNYTKKEECNIELLNRVRTCFCNQPWGMQDNYYVINGMNDTESINQEIYEIFKMHYK